ncbi:ovomucoid-like [Peromyscus eremicus]|uniref:ovomucoid-like n=1 Tax=Peromyscus eremicus TaxID=42410 RepID=UPI0027DAB957|nr:ovomucoid-like [Peromyscus eremicus]
MLVFSRFTYITLSFLLFSECFPIISAFTRSETICGMSSPSQFCPNDYLPVCGTDGNTYFNKCIFCNAYSRSSGVIKFKHYGKC